LRQWDLERPESLCSLITRVNRIRRDNRALQADRSLNFCNVDNDQLIAYVKSDPGGNIVLTVVNLDPRRAQYGWVELPLDSWQIDADQAFDVHDLLSEQRYVWRGRRNYVRLDPQQAPAHIFELRRSVGRTPGLA
jgi:starch synthase (maltosyl-transferring)